MEVYILDNLFRRVEVMDRYESLIWTERWASFGDFELKIRSTFETRSLLRKGVRLAMSHSLRVMVVEEIEDALGEDGAEVLLVKGPSIESILDQRGVMGSTADLETAPTWDLNNVPMTIARKLVHDICVTGILSPYDKINFMIEGRHPDVPASTIAEPVDPILVKLEPQSLYNALTNLANTWAFGFRLLLRLDMGQLYFDAYTGTDRTMSQTTRPPVLFTPALDNLQNITEYNSMTEYKNVAYVYSPAGFKEVLAPDVDPEVEDFDRRVMVVVATDITSGTPEEIESALTQKGREALSEHRSVQAFDGEISQTSEYVYGRDYYLGDLVEMRNKDGVANQMRVTEQIFVSDREGERSYPTVALNTFVSTGSWLSYQTNMKWIDYDTDTETVWSTLP